MKKVLLIIDVQNDFLPGGALAIPEGDQIIADINAVQEDFDLVVATQDWHPPTHKSFASNHPGKKAFERIEYRDTTQVLWPDHCVQETIGADFSKALRMHRVQAIFRKGMHPDVDSYSVFFDNMRLQATGLESYLKGMDIRQVFVCGLAGDYCVYYSALDAKRSGFDTYCLCSLTRQIAKDSFERALEDMKQRGIYLVS